MLKQGQTVHKLQIATFGIYIYIYMLTCSTLTFFDKMIIFVGAMPKKGLHTPFLPYFDTKMSQIFRFGLPGDFLSKGQKG